jgi:hypothetical protein
MTEPEWLTGTDPEAMLEFLPEDSSPRKLRLFAVACCWDRNHPLWEGPASRRAAELAERFADGQATGEELAEAHAAVHEQVRFQLEGGEPVWDPTYWLTVPDPHLHTDARTCAFYSANRAARMSFDGMDYDTISAELNAAEKVVQCDLIACIFGNPFRPVTFSDSWRTETAVALATGIYAERAFDRLPILADALEEAGCDDADVLNHLRGPGPHARGCWVVDGVLGKA